MERLVDRGLQKLANEIPACAKINSQSPAHEVAKILRGVKIQAHCETISPQFDWKAMEELSKTRQDKIKNGTVFEDWEAND